MHRIELFALFGILLALIEFLGLLGMIAVYFLWNWITPDLFGLRHVTIFEAWGLYMLAKTLIRGLVPSAAGK